MKYELEHSSYCMHDFQHCPQLQFPRLLRKGMLMSDYVLPERSLRNNTSYSIYLHMPLCEHNGHAKLPTAMSQSNGRGNLHDGYFSIQTVTCRCVRPLCQLMADTR